MPAFRKHVGYNCVRDAQIPFSNPFSSKEICRGIRTAFKENYKAWQRNEGANFWTSRAVDYQTEVSTKKNP